MVKWNVVHTIGLLAIIIVVVLVACLSPAGFRRWAWLVSFIGLALFAGVAGHGITGRFRGALIDTRNKVSLSRLQLFIWTTVVLSAFLTAALANIGAADSSPLAISVPEQLWLLMGISTTSLVGSPLIKSTKTDKIPDDKQESHTMTQLAAEGIKEDTVYVQGLIMMNKQPAQASWSDLFRGEETGNAAQLDLAKIQMFFFTLVLVLAYGASLFALFGVADVSVIHELPELSESMVVLLGISNAGYLTSKVIPHSEQRREE